MRRLKNIDLDDNLAQLFLMCGGIYVIATGFLLFTSEPLTSTEGIYFLLSKMMSLDAWAMLFFVSGALLIVSAFQRWRIKFLSMLVGGGLGGVLLVLYGVAGFSVSINLAIGVRYIAVGIFCVIISMLGGRELWTSGRKEG